MRTQECNLRLSNEQPGQAICHYWGCTTANCKLLQDLTWTNAPAVLPDNEAYARMSPAEVVKAYYAAQSKWDWEK